MWINSLHSLFPTPLCSSTFSNNIKPFCPIIFSLLFKSLTSKLITLTSSNLFYCTCKSLTNILWYSHALNNTITIGWNVYDMDAMYVCMNMGALQFSPPYKISSPKFLYLPRLGNKCGYFSWNVASLEEWWFHFTFTMGISLLLNFRTILSKISMGCSW